MVSFQKEKYFNSQPSTTRKRSSERFSLYELKTDRV